MYNNYNNLKKHVYTLLHPAEGNTRWDKLINTFLITLIVLNVFAVILETVDSIHSAHKQFFKDFDTVSVIIFSIEYLLRLWSANYHEKYKHSIKGRLKYFFSVGAMIDLIAILPTFLHIMFPGVLDLRILRMFRLARILRLFRLTAYTKSAQMIMNVFKSRFNDLMLSFILTIFLIIISSCLVYFAEHQQPKTDFTSIPATMWWAVVTLTTVGYGDMAPLTILGKIFGIFIMLSGVALLALPAGIITSGFLDELKNVRKPKSHTCPHCGMPLDDAQTGASHHHEKQ